MSHFNKGRSFQASFVSKPCEEFTQYFLATDVKKTIDSDFHNHRLKDLYIYTI
jgi:hypothetical protein